MIQNISVSHTHTHTHTTDSPFKSETQEHSLFSIHFRDEVDIKVDTVSRER